MNPVFEGNDMSAASGSPERQCASPSDAGVAEGGVGITTPTTTRELYAWYLYDWANSVYFTVAIGGFLPLQLLRLTELEWCRGKGILPAFCDEDLAVGFSGASVSVGALKIRPDSAATYFISLSVLTQALVFVTVGPLADFGRLRYRLLIVFGISGAVSTGLIFFIASPRLWYLCGIGIIVSNTCIGASIIMYNAFLPLLVDSHPDVLAVAAPTRGFAADAEQPGDGDLDKAEVRRRKNTSSIQMESCSDDAAEGIWDGPSSSVGAEHMTKRDEVRELVGNRISSRGFLVGFVSGVVLILICAGLSFSGIFTSDSPTRSAASETLVYRVPNLLSGIWWLGFGIISYCGLKARPAAAQLPRSFSTVAWLGFRSTCETLKTSWNILPNSFSMLSAWFWYSDGINTLASVGSIFAASELDMGGAELSIILAEVPLFAAVGTYVFQKLYESKRLPPKMMIEIILALFIPLPVYTILGFLPFLPFGMKHKWEMFVFGAWYGMLLGPVQSFSRGLYMDLVPKSQEARFFSLYEVTDKGSSWIGPLLAGLIANLGTMRYAMIVVLTNVLIGWFFLRRVRHQEGVAQARAFRAPEHPSADANGAADGAMGLELATPARESETDELMVARSI